MKEIHRKIGKEWVNLDPWDVFLASEFRSNPLYNSYIEQGKRNIKRYVDDNKTMLSLIADQGCQNKYPLHQLIYQNSNISSITARLQTAGRRYYHSEALKRIKQVIASEYANLPEFFRSAYSLDEVITTYLKSLTKDLTNKINKAATGQFYWAMGQYIDEII